MLTGAYITKHDLLLKDSLNLEKEKQILNLKLVVALVR